MNGRKAKAIRAAVKRIEIPEGVDARQMKDAVRGYYRVLKKKLR